MKGSSELSVPTRPRSLMETLALAVTVAVVTATAFFMLGSARDVPGFRSQFNKHIKQLRQLSATAASSGYSPHKRLLFYNRPPKTGSTTVRVAMRKALDDAGLVAAHCFNMIEWNEMALRTIVNRREVDFYGCHTRLIRERYKDVADMRGGNVTFMTSTRDPTNIIFSAYLQANRDKDFESITDKAEIAAEVKRYKQHISTYPVNALYGYHGADVPLTECPYQFVHEAAMRKIAERYEIVVDLERPKESAALVEIVTGLKPDFNVQYNTRTTDLSSPMLSALAKVDTSSRSCGNALVHKVLLQQFNVIKDRLMQNRCFDEANGTFELCDRTLLKKSTVVERNRNESFDERNRLRAMTDNS